MSRRNARAPYAASCRVPCRRKETAERSFERRPRDAAFSNETRDEFLRRDIECGIADA